MKKDDLLKLKPYAFTNSKGELIVPASLELPPDSYVFFISIKEWQALKENIEL